MKEIKTTKKAETREAYEPVKVEVLKVVTQGILCASGDGSEENGGLQNYDRF